MRRAEDQIAPREARDDRRFIPFRQMEALESCRASTTRGNHGVENRSTEFKNLDIRTGRIIVGQQAQVSPEPCTSSVENVSEVLMREISQSKLSGQLPWRDAKSSICHLALEIPY